MAATATVAIKSGDKDYALINESDFDAKKGHVRYEGTLPRDTVTSLDKNPTGTFSEPTPTDIRYPNKDHTEFENNHGAYIHRNAAEMRAEEGMLDAPGGLRPDPVLAEAVKVKAESEKAAAEDVAKKNKEEADAKKVEAAKK